MPLTKAPSGPRISASGLITVLVAWVTVTIFGAKVFYPSPQPLQELLTSTLAWQVLLAGVLLAAVITWRPGWREVGFRRPRGRDLRLLWFPVLVLALILGLAALMGLPAAGVTLLVLANTLLVGFSEEAMFRGLLFHGLRARFSIWPAILWTSGLFGAVHLLNGFVTGDFGPALVQAAMAACTGLFLMALFLRTGSLWVSVIYHALWDFAIFMIGLASQQAMDQQQALEEAGKGQQMLVPLLLILPNVLYGAWLLREVRPTTAYR
ncbi:CPBP family intramembrane metalloprotease [Salipiger pacificus]|nr:CPBP family intramembrane metalloprotease [Alloyangia pacifica]